MGPLQRTRDNEDSTASLRDSEMFGIKDSPSDCPFGSKHTTSVRPFTPCSVERFIFSGKSRKKAAECVIWGVKESGNVFDHDDGRRKSCGFSGCIYCLYYLNKTKG